MNNKYTSQLSNPKLSYTSQVNIFVFFRQIALANQIKLNKILDQEAVKTKQEAEAWFEERQKVGSYVINVVRLFMFDFILVFSSLCCWLVIRKLFDN